MFNTNKVPGPGEYENNPKPVKESSKNYSMRIKPSLPSIFHSNHNPGPGHCTFTIIQTKFPRIPKKSSSLIPRQKVQKFTPSWRPTRRIQNWVPLALTPMRLLWLRWASRCWRRGEQSNHFTSLKKSETPCQSTSPWWALEAINTFLSSENEYQ